MSVKAMGLVWDMECPSVIHGFEFRPNHKYTLLAYADHADHSGRNIYPAVETVARKTGLDARTVQRVTRDLEQMGLLLDDGMGPRGTNKWALPYSLGGDSLTPRQPDRGDSKDESLGDIPSGDILSGDTVPPELKNLNQNSYPPIDQKVLDAFASMMQYLESSLPRGTFQFVKDAQPIKFQEGVLTVFSKNAEWLEDRMSGIMERAMIGYLVEEISIFFVEDV